VTDTSTRTTVDLGAERGLDLSSSEVTDLAEPSTCTLPPVRF
jgi:hypothetical protein